MIGNAVHVMRIATGEIEDKVTDDGKNAAAVALDRARARANDLAPLFREIRAAGATTYRGIAVALNERGIPTARGRGNWSAVQVGRVLAMI